MTKPKGPTRRQRVQDMLARAAGDSIADYGGAGRFWELPPSELVHVQVHGIHLIAPEDATYRGSCCEHTAEAPDADLEAGPPYPGRGAASGLVKGLRGESPFDGSWFPRLMWGGSSLADEETQFISDWIDDGLPDGDHVLASFHLEGESSSLALESIVGTNVEHIARSTHDELVAASEYAYQHGEIRQRMNVDCMSDEQVDKLRFAFRELYALNKWPEDRRSYNNLAQIHQNHCQHGWERFLPWHRIYLYEFEQALQDHVADVTMPYWDWTMPQYLPEKPEDGWIIPRALQAYLTAESVQFLRDASPALPAPAADAVQKGMVDAATRYVSPSSFFAHVETLIGKEYTEGEHRNRFVDALLAANALWYPLRYPAEYAGGKTMNKVIHYHYPKPEDMDEIRALRSFRDFGGGSLYNDSFGFLDQNPHNTMHIWTGGMNPYKPGSDTEDLGAARNRQVVVAGRRFHSREDMYAQPAFGDMFSNLTASYDPIFWPIHANIDRAWWEWQQLNPHAMPADLDSVLTPWSYTTADTLDISRFGYEYVKSTYVLPVGLEAPVGRFVSRRIEVPKTVRSSFRQVEVRLHRVPQLPRSCFVRVFLNLPDANSLTSIDDPHYGGYLAIFGHGSCYGGPGHCEAPAGRRRFDLRPRSHNTPRNHRINVTKATRSLLDTGATSLQIALVVIGADYQEENDLLKLEGVSLTFLD